MFIPSTFKRPVSSWKALNLRKTLLMASSVRLKPLNCSRLPCVYAQETLRSEERRVGKECRSRGSPDYEKKQPVYVGQLRQVIGGPGVDVSERLQHGTSSQHDEPTERALA